MMFIRPKILRDEQQAAFITDSKYNYMRDQQKQYNKGQFEIPLLPGVQKPKLDPLPPVPPPTSVDPGAGSPDQKARQARERDLKQKSGRSQQGTPRLPQPPAGSVSTPPGGPGANADVEPRNPAASPGAISPPTAPPADTPPDGGKP
jgi:hypothetical protein